jgi:5'(3')-deoxyribonucleotidase
MNRVFVDMDGVIVDFDAYLKAEGLTSDEAKMRRGAYFAMPAMPDALESVRTLIDMGYEVWVATKPPTGIPQAYADKAAWILQYLPELKQRIIITHDKGLLGDAGDYLIDDRPHIANCESFAGTLIPFTNGTTWSHVLEMLRPLRKVA